MKLRWWIVGAVAVFAGGILVINHLLQGKELNKLVEDSDNRNYSEFQPGIPVSESEDVDFLT